MQIKLDQGYQEVVSAFFHQNPTIPHTIQHNVDHVMVELDENRIPAHIIQQINWHFKYLDLFTWHDGDVDDVVFWECPHQFETLIEDFQTITYDFDFNAIATLEARGFLLAGLVAKELKLPIIPIRKYQPYYQQFGGTKVEYTTWRGKAEALFLFKKEQNMNQRVLIVDDLIETSNSLQAAIEGLSSLHNIVVGAFYLGDVMSNQRRQDFPIPIRFFVRLGGLPF